MLPLLASRLLALGRHVVLHLGVVTLLIVLSHLVETLLLLVGHGLKNKQANLFKENSTFIEVIL